MKKNNLILKIVLFSLIFNISSPLFCEEKEEQKEEIPQVLQDIRRFEIITFGSLPFVLLDSSLVYSGIKWAQNDFASDFKPSFNQSNFSKNEKTNVLLTSLGICLGIGITDLVVNIVKRNREKKRQELRNDPILVSPIMPIAEDPEAIPLDILEKEITPTEEK